MSHRRLFCFFLMLPFLWLSPSRLCAFDVADLLPASCVRVTSLDELSENRYYVFVAKAVSGNFYLLSQEKADVKGSQKLKGEFCGRELNNSVQVFSKSVIWTIQKSDKFEADSALSILNDEGCLCADGDANLYIDDKVKTLWYVESLSESGSHLSLSTNSSLYLGLNERDPATNKAWFGYYKKLGCDSYDIYIYKVIIDFGVIPGAATMPTDGTPVALSFADRLMADDMTAISNTGLLLRDGQVAQDNALSMFTAHHVGTDNFTLSVGDNAFLNYDLEVSSVESLWTIKNGYIVTTEDSARYLTYLSDTEKFAVLSTSEATAQKARGVSFATIAAPADSTSDDKGTITLSGGWSMEKLANIDLEKYTGVVLTGISLPVETKPFAGNDKTNTIIYINKADADAIPDDWHFVVTTEAKNAALLRATTIIDRKPLYIAIPFTAKAGELTYTRQCAEDGNWETLCLPFAVSFPGGYDAEKLKVEGTNELKFYKSTTIEADTPIIFKAKSNPGATLTLTNSETGTISTASSPNTMNVFFGNYGVFSVEPSSTPIYMLSAKGDSFVRAAQGSTLDAFRCYLKMDGQGNEIRMKFESTQIDAVTTGEERNACYDLFGRRCTEKANKGIYITERKKLIKR